MQLSDFHFLKLIFYKLTHVHYLFINRQAGTWGPALIIRRATDLLIYVLLLLWALRFIAKGVNHLSCKAQGEGGPIVDPVFLVSLWAALALTFHFALPLAHERYSTSVLVFVWPVLVAEADRRRKAIIWLGLAVICVVSLAEGSYRLVEEKNRRNSFSSMVTPMLAALRQAPARARKIYVLSAGGLPYANPKYVSLALGLSAEIIRVIEIEWNCSEASDHIAFDYNTADGVVSVTITLPTCSNLQFLTDRFNSDIANGRLYRNDTLSYELPEAHPSKANTTEREPSFLLGRRMTVHVRPNGPARFVVEHGRPNGIAWFDTD